MNELQIFNNEEFGEVRTAEINGKPYFVANDVAKALGYVEYAKAIRTHCKGVSEMDTPTKGGMQKMKVIPEGDVYRLVIKSQLPSAEKFESWIFDEVIPSLRKNGGYMVGQEQMSPEQIVANALVVARNILAQKDKQISEMKPKAEFFDAVTDSKDAIEMKNVAKVLDMGMGRNKLFEFLRNSKVLMKDNTPYQKYVDKGWFRTIEQKYESNGEIRINIKTLVFQKGVDEIRKLICQGPKFSYEDYEA